MAEPKIIFCSNHHVYDASIHQECPYCRKIASEQKALSRSVNEMYQVNSRTEEKSFHYDTNIDEQETELINKSKVDEDSTELIRREDKNEATELIRRSSKSKLTIRMENSEAKKKASFENSGSVLGWFVFKNGSHKGHSIEICENTKYIYSYKDSCVLSTELREDLECLATIKRENLLCLIPKDGMIFRVNGVPQSSETIIHPYDEFSIGMYQLVYVELMIRFLGWGDMT